MYNWFDVPKLISNCLKKAMRNYEKELLEERHNNSHYDGSDLHEDSDEELSEIWSISGHLTITDIGDNEIKIFEDNQTSDSSRNEDESEKDSESETLTDNYMRFIETRDVENTNRSINQSQFRSDKQRDTRKGNEYKPKSCSSGSKDDSDDDDYADDEDSDNEDIDSESDDEMFDVCIRESLSRRCQLLPHYDAQKSLQYDDDDEEKENMPKPLTIKPIKRRYNVQEGLRVWVLRSEASKVMSNIFRSRCSIDS